VRERMTVCDGGGVWHPRRSHGDDAEGAAS
jgi:hypothetical protein